MKNTSNSEINKIDTNIIKHLRQNGRIPFSQLARLVGLSTTACTARVKQLETRGIIKAYVAQFDERQLQGENMAFVQLTMSDTRADALAAFNREIAKIAEIEACHMVAANFDYLLKVRSKSMDDYRRILAEKISGLPHVRSTSTFMVMEVVKE